MSLLASSLGFPGWCNHDVDSIYEAARAAGYLVTS